MTNGCNSKEKQCDLNLCLNGKQLKFNMQIILIVKHKPKWQTITQPENIKIKI